jgi:hypothetical protein
MDTINKKLPNRFMKYYKSFTDKAKWHYTTKPKFQSELFGFPVSVTVSDPTTMNQPTYHLWLDSPEAQAAAPSFPNDTWHNPVTKQSLSDEEYQQQMSVASEESSTATEAAF